METSRTETKTGKIFFVMVLSTMVFLSGFSAVEFTAEKNRLHKEFAESIRPVPQRLAVNLENPFGFRMKTLRGKLLIRKWKTGEFMRLSSGIQTA